MNKCKACGLDLDIPGADTHGSIEACLEAAVSDPVSNDKVEFVKNELRLSGDELSELVSNMRDFVDAIVKDGTDSVMPMLHIISKKMDKTMEKKHAVIGVNVDFNDHDMKRRFMEFCASKLIEDKEMPLIVVLVSEAWQAMRTPEQIESEGYVPPRDCPDREEVLLVSGVCMSPRLSFVDMMPISRNDKDMMVASKWNGMKPAAPDGLLDHLFYSFADQIRADIQSRIDGDDDAS